MSSLTAADKRYLEAILDMGSGYVLHFSHATFGEFFDAYSVDIHGSKYETYGTSKAKRMRAFWEKESDTLVARVLSELLDSYEADCDLGMRETNTELLAQCRKIVARLSGESQGAPLLTAERFLSKEFEIPDLQKLPVELAVSDLISDRLKEAKSCLAVGAHLSVILCCGSVLEAVLLGAAHNEPERFNRSRSSPKRNSNVKAFHCWTLAEFIEVAHDIGLLKPDVREFSHGLREFRNYIHPYQQLASRFAPDEHTAQGMSPSAESCIGRCRRRTLVRPSPMFRGSVGPRGKASTRPVAVTGRMRCQPSSGRPKHPPKAGRRDH